MTEDTGKLRSRKSLRHPIGNTEALGSSTGGPHTIQLSLEGDTSDPPAGGQSGNSATSHRASAGSHRRRTHTSSDATRSEAPTGQQSLPSRRALRSKAGATGADAASSALPYSAAAPSATATLGQVPSRRQRRESSSSEASKAPKPVGSAGTARGLALTGVAASTEPAAQRFAHSAAAVADARPPRGRHSLRQGAAAPAPAAPGPAVAAPRRGDSAENPGTVDNLGMVTPVKFVDVPGLERPLVKPPTTSRVPIITDRQKTIKNASTREAEAGQSPTEPRGEADQKGPAKKTQRQCLSAGATADKASTSGNSSGKGPHGKGPHMLRRAEALAHASNAPGPMSPVPAGSAYGLEPLELGGRSHWSRFWPWWLAGAGVAMLGVGMFLTFTTMGR